MSVPGSTSGGTSFECSLAGTVLPRQFQHLYDRLLGLCEHEAHSKKFEHEMLFTPAIQRPIYAARNDDVHLRLRVKLTVLDHSRKQNDARSNEGSRKRLKNSRGGAAGNTNANPSSLLASESLNADTEMSSSTQETGNKEALLSSEAATTSESSSSLQQPTQTTSNDDPSQTMTSSQPDQSHHGSKTVVTRQYQLCQYGLPEPGRTVVVRSAILVKIHGDAFGFLSLLGYGFEDEFVRRGYNFMYNNICRISVFRKYKVSKQHDPFSAIISDEEAAGTDVAESSSPWLVEITSSFVSQENVNSMSEEINVVRNLLAGSVAF